MTYASPDLSGRRPDQPAAALYLDGAGTAGPEPFVKQIGRRYQSGALVRFGVLFTAPAPVSAAAFSVAFGKVEGRLIYDDGLWSVVSPDAEGEAIPVAESRLVEGVEYAVSLTVDVGDGLYRDVIVDGRKVAPQVVDSIPGPQPADELYVVDLATGGPEPELPEWVAAEMKKLGAEELYTIAREQGGRVELSRTPDPVFEQVSRPAPLREVEGDAVFTFSVEASAPLTIQRAWAVEA